MEVWYLTFVDFSDWEHFSMYQLLKIFSENDLSYTDTSILE